MLDHLKLALAIALAAAGVAAYHWFGEALLVFRVLAVAGGVAAGAAIAATSAPGRAFLAFAREASVEVKKVVWPTRKETMQTTAAVFAFVVVVAIYLWISDKTLEWVLYELVLGWKRT